MNDAAGPRPWAFGPLTLDDGRLRFLDLARGLAIVFMVLQHVQLLFAVGSGEDSALGATFLLLGTAPAAPVFMVAMGFLFGSSARTGVRSGVVRGLQLFALGYALNLLRFVLPLLVRGDQQAIEVFGGTWCGPFFEIDILRLAGLTLIVLGPVKRYVRDPRVVLALAVAVATVAPLLWGVGGGSVVLDPLWGLGEWVSFPLFPWLAITLAVRDQPSWMAALLGVPILVASHILALGYGRLAAGWRGRRRIPTAPTALS